MTRFEGRTVAVTGAASGIGRAIAERVGSAGGHVVVVDVADGAETVAAVEDAGGSAEYRAGDVTDGDAMDDAFAGLSLDALVNNAAYYAPLVGKKVRFDEIEEDEWDTVMAVNAKGVFVASKAALPTLNEGGAIVNISSSTALTGTTGFLHYVASKAAVIGMTRSMANEVGEIGVRVNAVAPGFTVSEASLQAGEEYVAGRVDSQAIAEAVEPRDIADAVAYLAGPDSRRVTGQTLIVDGGKTFR